MQPRSGIGTMPVVCIGPVCVPWTCIPPIIFFCWKFIKPYLPTAVADAVESMAARAWAACRPYLEKIPGFGKKAKTACGTPNGNCCAAAKCNSVVEAGVVAHAASEAQLNELIERSKQEGFAIVLDFTAPWCKPCQALKPCFKRLANEYPKHVFMEVDSDELEDLNVRFGVMGLPTIQVLIGGQVAGSTTGGSEAKVVELVRTHLTEGSDKKER